ncbi:MAG: GNAT family N-acetyltransferase [Gemmatimonadales bacterium]
MPRLVAERLTPDHFDELFRMHQDARTMANLGGVRDEVKTREYLAKNLAHWAEWGYGVWVVRETASPEIIGRACVRHLLLDGIDEIEIGYAFYPAYWRKGYATEVALACAEIGLNQLGWNSVVAVTSTANVGSQRVMAKAGMIYERDLLFGGIPHVLFRRRRAP